MPLKIIFDNLNKERFPEVPTRMVNPGRNPDDITQLLEFSGQFWNCHGQGSTSKSITRLNLHAHLNWFYLSNIVRFSDYEGNTFRSTKPWIKTMRGSLFSIGKESYVFTGVEAMLFTCWHGDRETKPDFEWLYGIPPEAKVWCPRCGQTPPFVGDCEYIWEKGIMMGRLDGYEDNQHRPFERQEDGYTWVLPGEPPYPDIPELQPMAEPREQRPAVVANSTQLSLF